jgi:hypothetical protein
MIWAIVKQMVALAEALEVPQLVVARVMVNTLGGERNARGAFRDHRQQIWPSRPPSGAIASGPLHGIEPSPVGKAADQRCVRPAAGFAQGTSTLEPHTSAEFLSVGWMEAVQLTSDRHRLLRCG